MPTEGGYYFDPVQHAKLVKFRKHWTAVYLAKGCSDQKARDLVFRKERRRNRNGKFTI